MSLTILMLAKVRGRLARFSQFPYTHFGPNTTGRREIHRLERIEAYLERRLAR